MTTSAIMRRPSRPGLIFNAVNLLLVGTLVARRGGWFGGTRLATA